MSDEENPGLWYARRDGVVRGPFSPNEVSRYILLGRIRLDDDISTDQSNWQTAGSIASILPEEILNLSSRPDYQRLIIARLQVDERVADRRDPESLPPDTAGDNRRTGRERRRENAAMTITRSVYGEGGADNTGRRRAGMFVLTLVLAALVVAWLVPAFR